ncbi:hypothetical protein H4S01_001710 [Coemansia sp. RSA 2610]|nr:hypothetical protein H4S01_001710 [Coemansia sp. RSA 2610]
MAGPVSSADGPPFIPPLSPLKKYTGRLRRNSAWGQRGGASTLPLASPRAREITRVDKLWTAAQHSESPVLNIDEIIRAKDELIVNTGMARLNPASLSPHCASADSEKTLLEEPPLGAQQDSPRSSVATGSSTGRQTLPQPDESPETNAQRSVSLDVLPLRLIAGEPSRRRLRHDYFKVATMDGKPIISTVYKCPIAMCDQTFGRFGQLQTHWTEHPWNRGGILTPVCEGGVRRLGWWEHKRKFFASLVQGRQMPEFPEDTNAETEGGSSATASRQPRRRTTSMDEVCRSDYGDISLFGSRTYCVSPRVVPMWQVAQWEVARDAAATGQTLAVPGEV